MADAALEKGCVSLPSELLDKKVLNAHVMSQDAVYVGSSLVFEARLKNITRRQTGVILYILYM